MRRRDLLTGLAATTLAAGAPPAEARAVRRVRPGDPGWPSAAEWERLGRRVDGNLVQPGSLYGTCTEDVAGAPCRALLPNLRNPFFIGDQAGGTQVSGWLDAWAPAVSPYAVAAHSTADVVAAVNFARRHNLRVAVKGGGHSYQGTSNAPDSLLIWLHPMQAITMHDAFTPQGGSEATPAVSIEAGALWIQAYDIVSVQNGRYAQGGGCTTVGVAGHIQSGGYGSFSKRYGTAAGNLLEAEVVTADGRVRVCNERRNSDLFWALKGGGGGSFGVITRVTVRTHELPEHFGWASGVIKANSDAAYRRLITEFISFYAIALFNPHWGEQAHFRPNNTFEMSFVSQGLSTAESREVWAPFLAWIAASPADYEIVEEIDVGAGDARRWWDTSYHREHTTSMHFDPRPGAASLNGWWSGDGDQVSMFLHAYDSIWLPQSLLQADQQERLVDALFRASRAHSLGLHFNKGLAGGDAQACAHARTTATNPGAVDAFALAIIADGGPPPYLHIPGYEADLNEAHADAEAVGRAAAAIRAAGDSGSYVSESDYFNESWREAFWGRNYPRLLAIKRRYDPNGLFIVHHGVGSEDWSADGFTPA
ncbi:MAG: FAD-binding oxidoreductase [Hyphomonadaceae bacterium]